MVATSVLTTSSLSEYILKSKTLLWTVFLFSHKAKPSHPRTLVSSGARSLCLQFIRRRRNLDQSDLRWFCKHCHILALIKKTLRFLNSSSRHIHLLDSFTTRGNNANALWYRQFKISRSAVVKIYDYPPLQAPAQASFHFQERMHFMCKPLQYTIRTSSFISLLWTVLIPFR